MDAASIGHASGLMLLAWAIEAFFGWPNSIFIRICHPVVWIGWLISTAERYGNRSQWRHSARYAAGLFTTLIVICATGLVATLISIAAPGNVLGLVIEAVVASSLLASRSLYTHVKKIAQPLAAGNLEGAREAVSHVVGRDPNALDEPSVARAAIESLAENTSDGVVAPLFWGVLFGLPGLAVYKAINTLDSMIGHRNKQYEAFGGFAARVDDVVNFIPARLTGMLFALVSLRPQATKVMLRDARYHRSPNAGWPEAAMAGALGVRLSGPRTYGVAISNEPWLNIGAPDPTADHIREGLAIYVRSLILWALLLAALAWGSLR